MRIIILLLALSFTLWADDHPVVGSGKSGIEAIDTLSVHEWDVPTERNNLGATLLLGALLPGGAQFYTQHYVRGGFLLAIELALAYEVWINKPIQRQMRLDAMAPARDSVGIYTKKIFEHGGFHPEWHAIRHRNMQKVRDINDIKVKEDDLRYSETAWLLGLHLYGVFDGYGIWRNNQGRSYEKREVTSALWRGLLVPGWGQFYNGEYGKAGLLYMAVIGGVASYHTRQQVVDYFLERQRTALLENASDIELSNIEDDILFYRKKRNQYIWGLALIYLYSLADASVDAALSDFDSPVYWALWPQKQGWGLSFNASF